jgi:hypothetical protein
MNVPAPGYDKPTHTYGEPRNTDTWDAMRAGATDISPDEHLPQLLGILGVGNQPHQAQHEMLVQWKDGAAYHSAPPHLKAEIEEFLTTPQKEG